MKIDPAALDVAGAHEFMVGAILPRPIAWVSTIGEDGVYNLAPFSFFTGLSSKPAVLGFGIGAKRDGKKKDTLANIEFSKEFVINIVTESMAKAMNQTAGDYPSHVDEFKEVGLTAVKSDLVKPPRLAESPISMECRLLQILEFGQAPRINRFVIGEVVRAHIRDEFCKNGVIQGDKLKAVGRMGGDFYCRTLDRFEMKRPVIKP